MNSVNKARAEYGNFKEIEVKILTDDGHTLIYRFERPEHGRQPFAEIKYNIETQHSDGWWDSPLTFITNQSREFILSIKS